MSAESSSTGTTDQRREIRRRVEARVLLRFEEAPVEGTSDNLSSVGLMFFTEGAPRVLVEIEEDGERRQVSGRLVRLQRISESSTGIAIEFDDEHA